MHGIFQLTTASQTDWPAAARGLRQDKMGEPQVKPASDSKLSTWSDTDTAVEGESFVCFLSGGHAGP